MRSLFSRLAPLALLVALFLLGFVLCGAYVFLADRFCAPEVASSVPLPRSPLVHLLRVDGAQNQTSDEHGTPHRWIVKFFCEAKAADIALVFFTYGLMVVTGWLAWATLKLWKAGERQMDLIRDNAAQQSHDMREANAISHNTMVADQRPWITANDPRLREDVTIDEGGALFRVSIKITNIGKTPAHGIRTSMGVADGSAQHVRDEIEQMARAALEDGSPWTRLLLPNESYRRNWSLSLNAPFFNPARINPIIFGCVTYRISQDDSIHQTGFAFRLFSRAPITGAERSIGTHMARFPNEGIEWDSTTGGFAT